MSKRQEDECRLRSENIYERREVGSESCGKVAKMS